MNMIQQRDNDSFDRQIHSLSHTLHLFVPPPCIHQIHRLDVKKKKKCSVQVVYIALQLTSIVLLPVASYTLGSICRANAQEFFCHH